jgi:hypothetical protein
MDIRQLEYAGKGGGRPIGRARAAKSSPGSHDMYEKEGTYRKFAGSAEKRMFMIINNLSVRVGSGAEKKGELK